MTAHISCVNHIINKPPLIYIGSPCPVLKSLHFFVTVSRSGNKSLYISMVSESPHRHLRSWCQAADESGVHLWYYRLSSCSPLFSPLFYRYLYILFLLRFFHYIHPYIHPSIPLYIYLYTCILSPKTSAPLGNLRLMLPVPVEWPSFQVLPLGL